MTKSKGVSIWRRPIHLSLHAQFGKGNHVASRAYDALMLSPSNQARQRESEKQYDRNKEPSHVCPPRIERFNLL